MKNTGKRSIFITESQMDYINENKGKHPVDPKKVLVIKKYLDNGFKKGSFPSIGEDGYPKKVEIVAMIGNDGSVLRNMTDKQLFYLLQDRFSQLCADTLVRDMLLQQVIRDWYADKITKDGLLSKNLI